MYGQVHVYYAHYNQQKGWYFLQDDDGYAYCAKNMPASKKRGVERPTSAWPGCRRRFGVGPGFCNAETQVHCIASVLIEINIEHD